jgi:ATP-dependent Lhr-like helicase
METENNYILAARTASGKTEAAFLPILSKVDFQEEGVQVLYISPLIALINDQFNRVEELCKYLEVSVTKWHGEANRSQKKKLLKSPSGIVLITPESIEAMFTNAPQNAQALFGNLKYIVIDEIHSFLGSERGLQLMSLISRIQQLNSTRIVIIGLSATIGTENYHEVKLLTGDAKNTKVLVDTEKKETQALFKYFAGDEKQIPHDLLLDLYENTKLNKVLVFPNSRGRTEEVAVKLKRISQKSGGHKNYYSHHSSIDKEIREAVEYFAKNNQKFNFCIACTSTLELGIDIGTVDKIVQIDSTHSVSSLVQRIGRSGRREGEQSKVDIYTTSKWSLLQSLACWNLYQQDFLEPLTIPKKPYDILFHQVLSIVKQTSGCTSAELLHRIQINPTFIHIDMKEVQELIESFIKNDYLECLGQEIIIGMEGEKIVNSRYFYGVFVSAKGYSVMASGVKIGEIPPSLQVQVDQNILLAAKIWKIKDIDSHQLKIYVKPANDGKKPLFFGAAGDIHPKLRREMLKILKQGLTKPEETEISYLALQAIEELQTDFAQFSIQSIDHERPLVAKEESIEIYTFTGSKVNKSIVFLLSTIGKKADLNDQKSCITIPIKKAEVSKLFRLLISEVPNIDKHLVKKIEAEPNILSFSKWAEYLPVNYQCKILKERHFDFQGAVEFMEKTKF